MQTTYSQKNGIVPKTDVSAATSVLDSSSQSESLQRKADMANNAAQSASLPPRPNKTGMPDNLKSGIECLSGFSMDNVRVHYNSSKPATVQALAYTQGTDIHVAPGQEKSLPHEAWHVAQQMAGRVSPTTNINGMPVNDNAALEHEADVMGEMAVTLRNENVETKSKSIHGDALQLKPGGGNDMVCAADVLYRDELGVNHHVKGAGYNNLDDADAVLAVFRDHELQNLAAGNRYDGGAGEKMRNRGTGKKVEKKDGVMVDPSKDHNPAGQCAEPHAFADALKKIPGVKAENILDVFISESVIRKLGAKEGDNGHEEITNVTCSKENHIITYTRCATCAEWIKADGHVKPLYLEKKGDGAGIKDHFSELNPQVLKKYNHKEEDPFFYNVDFFNPEKNKPKVELTEKIPEWFTRDSDAQTINGLHGLRTVIKKQLLKNRVAEIIEGATEVLETWGVNEKTYYYLCHRKTKGAGRFLKESDLGQQEIANVSDWVGLKKDGLYKSKWLPELEICKKIDDIAEIVKKTRWAEDVEKIKGEKQKKLTIAQVREILKRNYVSENELENLRNKTGVEII